jgi:hypothetical protein
MSSAIDFQGIAAVDKQIATLLECKPLPESEVRALAEKVTKVIEIYISNRQKKFLSTNQTYLKYVRLSRFVAIFTASSTI